LALRFQADGEVETMKPPARHALGSTFWRISRRAGADAGTKPRLLQTLEDAPFYARSLVDCRLYDAPAVAFHESLSLDRFDNPIVKLMLPFRMPRRFF
jgi:carotenoid 1,2-hydratase